MSGTIEALEARIARLEDVEAIRRLKAHYLRACDLKQVEEVRASFLPGRVRIAYQGFDVFDDRDAFVGVYSEMACQGGVYDIHHAHNAEIEITGPDSATGLWSLDFRTILLASSRVTRLAVEYRDVYRRQEGRWWIEETESRITSFLTEEIAEDGFARYLAWGQRPAGRLSS